MFNNLGWGELLVLAAIGILIFGPDRLPKAAADAARMLRELRTMARGAAADLKAELGPEMADLDLTSLDPRRIVKSALLPDDEPPPGAASLAGGFPGGGLAASVPLAPGEQPPYDLDAT